MSTERGMSAIEILVGLVIGMIAATVIEALLHGKNHKVHVRYRSRYGRERSYSTGFEGVITFVKRRHEETESDWSRERYEGYMREVPCPVCHGARLKPESLSIKINKRSIADVTRLGPIGPREALDENLGPAGVGGEERDPQGP